MKTILVFLTILFTASIGYAQQGINYKAIISDNGVAFENKYIDVQFSLLENGTTEIYRENHNALTDKNGIIILNIGEGNAELGDFSQIDWSKEMFLKVEIDTGNDYLDFGTTAFKYVPYAKYADKAANVFSGNFNDLTNVPQGLSDGDDNTQLTEEQVDEFVENNGYIDVEVDGSTENELQILTIDDNKISLSRGGGTIELPDNKDDWGTQSVISNNTLEGYGTQENPLKVVGDLTDNQNISKFSLLNDSLTIDIENGNSQTVDLSSLKDGTGTDNQNISVSVLEGSILTIGIENGNFEQVDLSSLKDGTGTDNQNISKFILVNDSLTIDIENGNSQTVDLSPLKKEIGLDDLRDAKSCNDDNSIYIGNSAGKNDSLSKYNVGIGKNSLLNNTKGFGNVAVGYKTLFKNSDSDNNIAIGFLALSENGKDVLQAHQASNNIAIGSQSLESNSTGYDNIGIGSKALGTNTIGYENTSIGSNSLENNIDGYSNTALGFRTLSNNLTGGYNTAIGVNALLSNNASRNTAVGYNTLFQNSSGENNIAIGINTLYSNDTGSKNIAIGNSALYKNTVKSNLIAIGDSALYNNGTNSTNYNYSIKNIAIGTKSLFANTVGNRNIAIGYNAMKSNISGVSNTAIGSSVLYSCSIGGQNTGIGEKALFENKIGFRNTAIGYNAGYKATGTGNVFIGNKAGYYEVGNNKLYIDNSNTSKPLIGGDFSSDIVTINGKLGINTNSPEAKLHVNGDVRVNETLRTGGSIYSEGSIKAEDDFAYNSPKTYYYQIHPLDFKVKYGDGQYLKQDETTMWIGHDNGYSSEWYDGEAYAQIRLPQGAKIKNIKYYYKIINSGGGTARFTIALFRKNITTSPAIEVMGTRDHGSPTGNVYIPYYINNITNSTIDNYYYQYVIKLFFNELASSNENTDDVSFYGATIEYTIDKVTP